SQVLISSRFSAASRASALARRGSSQTPGCAKSLSSSSARTSFAGRSKVLLELENPLQQLLGAQLNVHLLSFPRCQVGPATPGQITARHYRHQRGQASFSAGS